MKYLYSFSTLTFTFLLLNCGGEEQSDNTSDSENHANAGDNSLDETDTIAEEPQEPKIFTVHAIADGPENSYFLMGPTDDNDEELPFPEFNELHIIPDAEWGTDDEIDMTVSGIMYGDFQLWDERFSDGELNVKAYYNRSKSKLAAEYHTLDGKADGMVTMYTPEGDVYMKRMYNYGELEESIKAPYGFDWEFNQATSSLRINDEDDAFTTEEGFTVVKLMPSMHYSKENSLETIVEKPSFENEFKINGDPFTGYLEGYAEPYDLNPPQKFSLQFKDGWLNGDIKIYTFWGDLQLHEKFVMGELDTTVFVMDPEAMDGVAKPIIYLYPEKEQIVEVDLNFKGKLTHTYPKYKDGWKVLAKPDGTLIDGEGKEYYALYWEGNNQKEFTVNEGFVVPGNQTAEFLEESLAILGLNRREANEFIVFWLPHLEDNPYNLIHFSSDEYEAMAEMKIQPQPETIIRVMMVYQPLSEPIEIPVQDLNKLKKERKGFTVVEWGGSELSKKNSL